MEPVDYLRIVQRRWKVVAGLIVVAVIGVLVFAPREPSRTYEATHVLLRERPSGDGEGLSSMDNVEVVGMWATFGQVPDRVAERLGRPGAGEELAAKVTATGDPQLNTVEITATAGDADEAMAVANSFAEELLAFLDERAEELARERADDLAAREERLRGEIALLGQQIVGEGPGADLAEVERDGLLAELDRLRSETQAGAAEYVSLQPAVTATLQDQFVVGATRLQLLLLALVVAAALGVGIAILLDRSDQRLHTKQQTERQFGLPVLSEVPRLPVRSRHRGAVHAYQNDPRVAEAHRSLRTALLLFRDRLPLELEAAELAGRQLGQGASAARQVIVVTSPEAGEGKSTTAANLALAYAEGGERVLLVQWDLWHPLPARVLGADDGPGVSEFLQLRTAPLVRFVQDTSVPGVQLVAAGRTGHHPGGQLDAELRLLEEARGVANVVIVDTAPLLSASVTRELVTMADVVVLTCRAGRTASPAAQRCSELLKRLGAPTLGVVLVGVPTGPFTEYYGATSDAGRPGGPGAAPAHARGDDGLPTTGEYGLGSPRRHYRDDLPQARLGHERPDGEGSS